MQEAGSLWAAKFGPSSRGRVSERRDHGSRHTRWPDLLSERDHGVFANIRIGHLSAAIPTILFILSDTSALDTATCRTRHLLRLQRHCVIIRKRWQSPVANPHHRIQHDTTCVGNHVAGDGNPAGL